MSVESTYIIAEVGVNHNGSLSMARELVEVAADAGANAVKFQTFRAEDLVSAAAPKAGYQSETTKPDRAGQCDAANSPGCVQHVSQTCDLAGPPRAARTRHWSRTKGELATAGT